MHGLESDAIVKLFTPLFIKFKSCLQKCLFNSPGRSPGRAIILPLASALVVAVLAKC